MEMTQAVCGGQEALASLFAVPEVSLRRPAALGRAFRVAVGLHVAGVVLLALAIRYWPAVAPAITHSPLELDLVAPSAAREESAWRPPVLEQAWPEAASESRAVVVPAAAAIPEARPAALPEPEVMPVAMGFAGEPVALDTAGILVDAVPPASGRPAISGPVREKGAGHPIALSAIMPRYPYSARARGETGKVTVSVHVSPAGTVESAEVVSGSGVTALDESALAAARKACFKPAEEDGRAVAADINLQFDFQLKE